MAIKIPPPPNTEDTSIWQDWYIRVKNSVNNLSESLTWTSISKVGSNLTDILTRNHNDLQNIQGGSSTERYHLTSTQATDLTDSGDSTLHYHSADRSRANHTGTQAHTTITGGINVTITTAKITAGGANGSMTFQNGILTSYTAAT